MEPARGAAERHRMASSWSTRLHTGAATACSSASAEPQCAEGSGSASVEPHAPAGRHAVSLCAGIATQSGLWFACLGREPRALRRPSPPPSLPQPCTCAPLAGTFSRSVPPAPCPPSHPPPPSHAPAAAWRPSLQRRLSASPSLPVRLELPGAPAASSFALLPPPPLVPLLPLQAPTGSRGAVPRRQSAPPLQSIQQT